jgi:RNA polymerase sigma factor (sigma-70 family)
LNYETIFMQWMADHERLIRHLIIGFEAKPALQDELLQDIALNIWRALPSFRQDASVKTFVARIAHNVLATHVAKAVKTVKTDQDFDSVSDSIKEGAGDAVKGGTHQYGDEHHSAHQTPYQALDKKQRQQRLSQAIRQLKLEYQQVITLVFEGMSYQDIAEVLGISTNLVGVRLKRAKNSLTQLLSAP